MRTKSGAMTSYKTGLMVTALVLAFGAPVAVHAQEEVAMAAPATQKMAVTSTSRGTSARRIVVTDKPMSQITPSAVYQTPRVAQEITPSQVLDIGAQGTNGMAATKVSELSNDLFALQSDVARLSDQLLKLELDSQEKAASYYASVATINTQLQTGTTPGNPRLVSKLSDARANLNALSDSVSDFNGMAVESANKASVASFLLENIRAAYGLSGSTEEEHAQLAQLEDAVLGSTVVIERLLNNVNDDISRSAAYLSAERANLQTLSLAVSNGELYGRSLANRPFANVPQSELANRFQQTAGVATPVNYNNAPLSQGQASMPAPGGLTSGPLTFNTDATQAATSMATKPATPRPLMTIKFDRPNVQYQQPLYVSVNEAMQVYPDATFELVAVAPGQGNAAKMALEGSKARRNAEDVLRAMTQMGVTADKVMLSSSTNPNSDTSEVQLYIR